MAVPLSPEAKAYSWSLSSALCTVAKVPPSMAQSSRAVGQSTASAKTR